MKQLLDAEMLDRAKAVLDREARALQRVSQQLDATELARVTHLLSSCLGHVLVTGAGTSRAMAERFAHLLSCCGTPALYISAADSLHGTAGAITPRDVVFVISKGGRSTEVNRFAEIAKARGATLIAQTEAPDSPLARMSDAVLTVRAPREIDPFDGMLALGSSLVNGAVGDVLCALLLEMNEYAFEDFGRTHPGGAVGERIRHGETGSLQSHGEKSDNDEGSLPSSPQGL